MPRKQGPIGGNLLYLITKRERFKRPRSNKRRKRRRSWEDCKSRYVKLRQKKPRARLAGKNRSICQKKKRKSEKHRGKVQRSTTNKGLVSGRGPEVPSHKHRLKESISDPILGANYRLVIFIYHHIRKCNSMDQNNAVSAPNWEEAQHTSQYALSYLAMRNHSLILENDA